MDWYLSWQFWTILTIILILILLLINYYSILSSDSTRVLNFVLLILIGLSLFSVFASWLYIKLINPDEDGYSMDDLNAYVNGVASSKIRDQYKSQEGTTEYCIDHNGILIVISEPNNQKRGLHRLVRLPKTAEFIEAKGHNNVIITFDDKTTGEVKLDSNQSKSEIILHTNNSTVKNSTSECNPTKPDSKNSTNECNPTKPDSKNSTVEHNPTNPDSKNSTVEHNPTKPDSKNSTVDKVDVNSTVQT